MHWVSRFWSWVEIRGKDECWPWQGYIHKRGYGRFQRAHGEPWQAHRAAWIATFGPIPFGKLVCHKCDNRPCCNPKHLFLGTSKENTLDMVRKGRAPKSSKPGQIPRKLTWEKVREIRKKRKDGVMIKTLAVEYKVDYTMIQNIIHQRNWKEKVSEIHG